VSATLFYVFVYTLWLKRSTSKNIVIGRAAGAVPVLVGWAAVTGSLGWAPVVLFGIIVAWTPPHTWALAVKYRDDYTAADVPMLPSVASLHDTSVRILAYTCLLWAVTLGFAAVAGWGCCTCSRPCCSARCSRLRGPAPARPDAGAGDAPLRLVDLLHLAAVRGDGARPAAPNRPLTVFSSVAGRCVVSRPVRRPASSPCSHPSSPEVDRPRCP
jgi:hypothetical protein